MADYGVRNSVILYGSSGKEYAQKIYNYLQEDNSVGRSQINDRLILGEMELNHFPNGEPDVRIGSNVRKREVYIVQSFFPKDTIHNVPGRIKDIMFDNLRSKYGEIDEDLLNEVFNYTLNMLGGQLFDSEYRRVYDAFELLTINDAAKRASAGSITNVLTTYPFGRQDRKSRGRQPITAKMFANLIERSGADAVFTMDMHADQLQGFFDISCDNLNPGFYFLHDAKEKFGDLTKIKYRGADQGANKKMERLLVDSKIEGLKGVEIESISKSRDLGREHYSKGFTSDVYKQNVVSMDDCIDTAGTFVNTAKALFEQKRPPESLTFYATEALLSEPATERLEKLSRNHNIEIVTTDVLPYPEDYISERSRWLRVIPVHQSFAHAIDRRDKADSVSDVLFKDFETFENYIYKTYPTE
ncbi:MAG: ribose-phosphate diphosphokinase [Candidatus Aenigmarchaeota archaeon]|nr:ribose-phosphate diphosphokinase [Candidatus Aenigmarchaeota archaeon]